MGDQHEQARHEIIRGLVRKAEGVFLWLCLAVKSLNAGLDNEDDLEEVSQRAESLPPDLARLYMDMWIEFNESHTVYRQSTALYLKLIMASLRAPWKKRREGPGCLTQMDITVFEMAIATASPEFRFELAIPTAEELAKSCNETIRLVQTRCAGLLEIVIQPRPIRLSETRQHPRPRFSTAIPFGDGLQTVRFIHRAAFDFLTGTAEGGAILSADVTLEQSLHMKLFRAGLSTRCLFQGLGSKFAPSLETYTQELSRVWYVADSCRDSALDVQFQEIVTFFELSNSSGSLPLYWSGRHKSEILRKDEFLVYAACFHLSKYAMAALAKREICDPLKSDVLLAISARIACELSPSQDDIALAEELLHRGADPNYKGCVLIFRADGLRSIASPFCEFLVGINANLHYATKLSIQRVCHAMDGFLEHGANTSDLVNVNLRILDSGEVEFISVWEIVLLQEMEEQEGEEEKEEEEETSKFCSLLVPASILINALVYQLEEALCETRHSQKKCCDIDHVAVIRAKAKLIDTAVKPRVIALSSGAVHCRVVSDEDSVYLSDAIVKVLTHPRTQEATAMLRDRYLEVYRLSERRSSVKALLEDEGLIWDFQAHKHGPDEEYFCTR